MSILKVGAAKADITPDKYYPIPFFMTLQFNNTLDKIHVRVLDVESDERVLFVTFDSTLVPNPFETFKYICEVSGLDEKHVFMCATHTHCVPVVGVLDDKTPADDKRVLWYADIKKAIKQAITDAAHNKQPAKVGFGKGKSYVNVNRDEVGDDGKAFIGINFERVSDKTLKVIKFEDMNGKPIAFLTNFAVHATVMNGCYVDNNMAISGDIAGATSNLIEETYPESVCLWTSGAAGDQNPRMGTQYTFDKNAGLDGVKNLGATGHIILDFLAKEHAHDIKKVIECTDCNEESVKITAQKIKVKCAGRNPAGVVMLAQLQGIELPPPKDMEYVLRLVTIGDTAIQGISAEVVTSIGAAATAVSTAKNTLLITQADHYTGYVPDDWEYDHNAFEAEGATVAKGAAQPAFVEGFAKMFANVK